jgi:GDPmannose 4,6-dehydratase
MKKKIALITGVTGQDGSYLSEFLIKKKYEVHGIIRKSSSFNTSRIDHIYQSPSSKKKNFFLHYGDLSDASNLSKIIESILPDEIYNLAAQSHVGTSFHIPEYTSNVNALGPLRILEIIRSLKNKKKIKFYQASTSELYGMVSEKKQNENSNFNPISPYATAKLYAYWITRNYREAYNIFASNGILFNHESPRRGRTFVTKKITYTLSKIYFGIDNNLFLGNLDSLRDWGHARDYAEMQWKILQHKKADDFVISTDFQCSVRKFAEKVANELGFKILWKGKGLNEKGYVEKINKNLSKFCKIKKGDEIILVSKKYFRPLDVENLWGDSSKARKILKWKPKYSLDHLVKEMVKTDFNEAYNDFRLKHLYEKE